MRIGDKRIGRLAITVAFLSLMATTMMRPPSVWGDHAAPVFLLAWGAVSSPWGVAVDDSGNVYVADKGNGRIQGTSPRTPKNPA
jgi:hypothetical protein